MLHSKVRSSQTIFVIDVVQQRREASFPILSCCLTDPLQRTGQTGLAQCPGFVALGRVSFGPIPFLRHLRRVDVRFVRQLLRYYGSVRLPNARSSSACILGLPDTVCLPRRPWDLPVPIPNVSMHAWGLRPRGVLLQHRHSLQSMWPSVLKNAVGTPIPCDDFAAQYPACTYLCQRPARTLASTCV